mmetsp:Transcript_11757/g.20473  ORF Transcript_11757/g.20473 Transcript_11757/m.20473 type:complete len:363 (-) Transcript_11757:335-1423(-)
MKSLGDQPTNRLEENKSDVFHKEGYCTFDGIVPQMQAIRAATASTCLLSQYLHQIQQIGAELGIGMKNGFSEVVLRSAERYDIKVAGQEDLLELVETVHGNQEVVCFLHSVLGLEYRLCHKDVVISLPGATQQQWHTDGAHLDAGAHRPCHCLNLFVPLVDLAPALGPTELRPQSHFLTRDLKRQWLVAYAKKQIQQPVTPILKAGSVLAFDYRLLHRGLANTSSQPRPVLVLTYSKPWFVDVFNFPSRSIFDYSPIQCAQQWELGEDDDNHHKKANKKKLTIGSNEKTKMVKGRAAYCHLPDSCNSNRCRPCPCHHHGSSSSRRTRDCPCRGGWKDESLMIQEAKVEDLISQAGADGITFF